MITLLVTSSGISQTVWETLSYDLQLLKQLLLNTIITIILLLTDTLLIRDTFTPADTIYALPVEMTTTAIILKINVYQ